MKASQRKRLDALPRMKVCARHKEGTCKGRVTWEHPFARLIGGVHVPDAFVIGLCAFHHGVDEHLGGGDLNKEVNKLHAYQNISTEELARYKLGATMIQERAYLSEKYKHLL